MRFHPLALMCLSFMVGLLVSGLDLSFFNANQILVLTLTWALATAIATLIMPRWWRRGPSQGAMVIGGNNCPFS